MMRLPVYIALQDTKQKHKEILFYNLAIFLQVSDLLEVEIWQESNF